MKGKEQPARMGPAPLPEPPTTRNQYPSRAEMFSSIKGLGRNWDSECESLLAPPASLFRSDAASSSFYSGDDDFGIIEVTGSLSSGRPALPDHTYGLAVQEKAGSVSITLADISRRIIVRMRMVSYGDESVHRDWADFKEAIRAAVARASSDEAKRENLVAVHDGLLKLVRPSETFGMLRSPPSTGIMRGDR